MKSSQTNQDVRTSVEPLRLTMQRGPLGFDDYRHFVLENLDDAPPFKLLLSIDDADIAFFVAAAEELPFEYQPRIPVWSFVKLGVPESSELEVFVIVSIDENGCGTANLRAPVLIHRQSGMALQVVLDETLPLRRALNTTSTAGP